MKLACSSMLVPANDYREKLALLEQFGYEGIEIRLPGDEASPERVAEIEAALAESTIEVSSLIVPDAGYMTPLDSKEARDLKVTSAKNALNVGARLGGGVFIMPEYRAQSPLPLWHRPDPLSPLEEDLLYGLLSEVANHAEKVSAVAVIEPINRYETHFYNRLDEGVAVCERVGSDHLKMVADFFHMNIEEDDIAASIEHAGKHVYHVQLGDSNRELPGWGHTDFQSGFAALRRVGYDRYMALECRIPNDPTRDLPACAQYLRECLADSSIV